MRTRLTRKRRNSGMCLVCGLKNPSRLGASFPKLGNGDLLELPEQAAVAVGGPR